MTERVNQIQLSWDGWEDILYTKLVQLDHLIEEMQYDLVCAGMKKPDTGPFIAGKVLEMNKRIQAGKK